tara:strand:+ start:318 stop:491 length:174 start_codon:yes stop_codon:yes gene_type:complete
MANDKRYTAAELLKKFKGKFIETYRHYDYVTKETTYEVRSVKRTIHENHNLPKEEIR